MILLGISSVRHKTVHERELAKLGAPIDRTEWFMTPQTVNAYYNPTMNEIVFPAAILQPPFFNMPADDAVNYGGIGGVIAMKLAMVLNDSGSRYNGDGALEKWWTDEDKEKFAALTLKNLWRNITVTSQWWAHL